MANGDDQKEADARAKAEADAKAKQEAKKKEKANSVVPGLEVTSSARNPIDRMIDIVKDPDISDEDKAKLILYARNNFKNRRKMAYICLTAIVMSFALLFLAAFIDGTRDCKILGAIQGAQGLFASIEAFLTAIVGAYYGVSAWRPSS